MMDVNKSFKITNQDHFAEITANYHKYSTSKGSPHPMYQIKKSPEYLKKNLNYTYTQTNLNKNANGPHCQDNHKINMQALKWYKYYPPSSHWQNNYLTFYADTHKRTSRRFLFCLGFTTTFQRYRGRPSNSIGTAPAARAGLPCESGTSLQPIKCT